jgi:hypothetical protein
MFLQIPFKFIADLQNTVLVINTVLLLGALIVIELIYAEKSKDEGKNLKFLFPMILVFIGLLIYAAIKQVGQS